MKERIKWVDVAKFLGIFAIYLGHFGTTAGMTRDFVFIYHVPLFFFLSGCMSTLDNEKNILKFVWKKLKSLMIPFWIFALLSIVVTVINNQINIYDVKDMLVKIAYGCIRNRFVATSLWFLPCLFVMEIIFKLIKFARFKVLMLAICVAIYVAVVKLIVPGPHISPSWEYNVDSALYFIIYYAIGYAAFPYIASLFKLDTLLKKIVFFATGALSFIYSALQFFGKADLLPSINKVPVLNIFSLVISAICIIWFNLIAAKLLENVALFNEIGRSTLYLCCNEYFMHVFTFDILTLFGLKRALSNPLQTYIFVIILLVLCTKLVAPAEKKLARSIASVFAKKSEPIALDNNSSENI